MTKYYDKYGKEIQDNDVIDIGQTVNGESKFIIVDIEAGDVRYYHNPHIKYEYDVHQLLAPGEFGINEIMILENLDFIAYPTPPSEVSNVSFLEEPPKEKLYIVCSAVKYKDHIIHGRRHGDAYQTLEKFLPKEEYNLITRENTIAGFIDQYGDFHTRAEAWEIAVEADQIKYGKGTQASEEPIRLNINGKEAWGYQDVPLLISEHLFPEKD